MSYDPLLGLWEGTPGDPAIKNAWGALNNTNFTLIGQAVTGDNGYAGGSGGVNIAGLTTYTLTANAGASNQARQLLWPFVGALTGNCTVTVPASVKVGYVLNATTGGHNVILTTGSGTTLVVSPGPKWTLFYCDGTNVTAPTITVALPAAIAPSTTITGSSSGIITLTAQAVAGTYNWNWPTTAGTAGQYLTSQAGSAAMTWSTPTTPIGAGMEYWGTSAPALWIFAYGQAISRTTYAALFAVMGTTYGTGDGSTTFNVPDMRGRTAIGKDNMGGTPANRVTNAVSGIAGTTLGAVGGDQHAQADSITINDPSHQHAILNGGAYVGSGGAAPNVTSGSSFGNLATSTNTAVTGITASSSLTGASQNMPPGIICNYIIYAGV